MKHLNILAVIVLTVCLLGNGAQAETLCSEEQMRAYFARVLPEHTLEEVLADDYRVWKQGGKAAFDWSKPSNPNVKCITLPDHPVVALPVYDVERFCRQFPIGKSIMGNVVNGYNICRNREQEAYDELKWLWPELHTEGQATLRSVASRIGSYQALLDGALRELQRQELRDQSASSQPFRR